MDGDLWENPWGHTMQLRKNVAKKRDFIRIIFWNCGGFPTTRVHPKNQVIREVISNTQADVAALAEINVSWKRLPPHDRLRERMWGWFSNLQIAQSYAVQFPAPSASLAGGTAVFTIADSIHLVAGKSGDELGRWSSTKLRGTGNTYLRIIAAYRCVRNIYGPLSVWNQQRYLFDINKWDADPIEKFDADLREFIGKCISDGEQVIVGIDVNEDIRSGKFQKMMNEIGFTEIMTFAHGLDLPPTYSRGSAPIDAIFVSANLLGSQCGYAPSPTDHRVLWVDIPCKVALGRSSPSFPIRRPQRLILQDPRVVSKYLSTLTDFLTKQDFLSRVQSLSQKMVLQCTESLVNEYDELDKIRLEGILLAEKKCRNIRAGQVAFSPTLVVAWNKIHAWKLLRKKLSGKKVNTRYLQRSLKAANIRDISLMTLSEVDEHLASSWAIYKKEKKDATTIRATWLEELAAARAADGKISISQELKNLITREQQCRNARSIKYSLSDHGRTGLSSIEVQDDSGKWVELTNQEEMEDALLQELSTRFNQAAGTPFSTEPLLSAVGPFATFDSASAILNGKFSSPESTDEWASRLLPFFKQVIPTVEATDLSPEQYAAGWKRVKEKTSAGPSGITIPHMKAHGMSQYMSEVDSILANLPYRYGFSPLRWRKGVDVMLEKKAGIRQLQTLRAILLYEADFNQNNKRLGQEILYRAEAGNSVAIEQFGSRKNMSATDQSLNKALTFDLWRQRRQNGALCCNDAKGCYDRIVHNCASLCLQRVRTRPHPITSMFETIQKLEHHVRTVFEESKKYFVQSGTTPIQGVGQGNGAGPQIWALVSTPVLNMLRAEGKGATFVSAITRLPTTLVGFAFVDDTDLVTSGPNMSTDEVCKKIQESLTAWEGGIRATGGAIEPKKSHWYLVDFDWKEGIPIYKSVKQSGGQLKVRDPAGNIQILKQLEPGEAERTLGIRLAPNGSMDVQFDWMKETARKWAEKV
jgi:hypothetical protein